MSLAVTESPWTFVFESMPVSTGGHVEISGLGSPRLLVDFRSRLWLKGGNGTLPKASFPFQWGNEVRQSFYLPTNSKPCDCERENYSIIAGIGQDEFQIVQKGIVGRFKNDDSPLGASQAVTGWINWLINCFQNLTHLDDKLQAEDSFDGLTRREWSSVVQQFLKSGSEDALMSLIVKLAGDRFLKGVLQSVSENPRKVLKRVREELAISRIQQLDAACIRDFARRPGRDAAEKAGPRQKLLALNRIENTNTLENRVAGWVMDELAIKSKSYVNENKNHKNSGRVRDVRRLGFNAGNWRSSELMESVISRTLQHPIQPNYPLQLDRRYHKIYETYKLLLQDERVHDDAWMWQRSLWACSARAVFYARLTERYGQRFTSFSVMRNECNLGNWFEGPVAPGPFMINEELCYVIDSQDILSAESWFEYDLLPGARYLGMTGCDAVLFFPKKNKMILVWYSYWTGGKKDFFNSQEECADALKQVEKAILKHNQQSVKLNGLLIGSSIVEDELQIDSYKDKVSAVLLPAKSHGQADKFDEALDLVVAS